MINSIRVEDSQCERKFISISNKEYEIIDTGEKSLYASVKKNEIRNNAAKINTTKNNTTKNDDVTAYLNYLEIPVKIDM